MAIIKVKPTSPGRRGLQKVLTAGLHKGKPYAPLLEKKISKAGRNHHGRITVRHQGGGHKQHIRVVDFKRVKDGIPAKVERLEYDPNRSSRIALIKYVDGDWRYILAPNGIKIGDPIMSGPNASIDLGNALPLDRIPAGTLVHNVELKVGKGGQIVRSAGSSAQVLAKEGRYTLLRLPSGEMRNVLSNCMASIGQLGAVDNKNIKLGKAGKKRHIGRRPEVRGVAMAPNAHPHGGGEGKSPIGMPGPKTPWGKPALGYRTRKTRKPSDRFIVRRRYQK